MWEALSASFSFRDTITIVNDKCAAGRHRILHLLSHNRQRCRLGSYRDVEVTELISRSWKMAAITIGVLIVASSSHEILRRVPGYAWLHSHRPFYVAESIDKVGGAILCMLAVGLMCRTGGGGIAHELGLSAPVRPAIALALVASSPMLIGFAVTRSMAPNIRVLPLAFLAILSPFVEELEFRGFGVRYLQRATGWPFWLAVWPSTLLFGYGHVDQGATLVEMAELFLLTGAGGVAFAWLVYRWQNLWVAVALHICMNLWWELFSVAKTAIGGWFPFALQNLTILLAVCITLYCTHPRKSLAV
jgi:membrane protease YdiL (CAAX protease family)